jgi:hypothetical protein
LQFRDVELVQSTIDNGRIYFSNSDVKFFPSDSFGDREGDGHKGAPVVFRAGSLGFESDIRVSSGQRLSPRRSFADFLKSVGAVTGASLRVTRVAEREYQVEYRR